LDQLKLGGEWNFYKFYLNLSLNLRIIFI